MKKKNLLLVILVLVISLVVALSACHDEVVNPNDTTTNNGSSISATDFFTAAANLSDCKVAITIKSQDGETIYTRDTNGKESDPYGLGFGTSTFTGTASGLTYTETDFTDPKIVEDIVTSTNTYSATIASPKDYLGISTGDVSNATISMVMDESKSVTSIVLKYTHTIDGYAYNTEIKITK